MLLTRNCWKSLFKHQPPTLFFKLPFEVAEVLLKDYFNTRQGTLLGKGNSVLTRLFLRYQAVFLLQKRCVVLLPMLASPSTPAKLTF